jgi:DNA-binding MarR family transcriptional regulator
MNIANQIALFDPLEAYPGYQLRRCANLMNAELGAELTRLGLKSAEATVLLVIDANPGCTQSEIGRLVNIKRANMVPLVATLTDADLIRRSRVDGRSQALELSARGKTMIGEVRTAVKASETRLAAGLSPREAERLVELLRKLRRSAGDEQCPGLTARAMTVKE